MEKVEKIWVLLIERGYIYQHGCSPLQLCCVRFCGELAFDFLFRFLLHCTISCQSNQPVSRLGRKLRAGSTRRLVAVTRQKAFSEDAISLLFVECGRVTLLLKFIVQFHSAISYRVLLLICKDATCNHQVLVL